MKSLLIALLLLASPAQAAMTFAAGQLERVALTADTSLFSSIGAITIMGWMRPTTLALSEMMFISTSLATTSTRAACALLANGTLRTGGRSADADAFQNVVTTSTLSINTWYHVACVINYATDVAQIYVNGTLQTTTGTIAFSAATTAATTSDGWNIGAQDAANEFFTGTLDDVRVYTAALSATRIANIARSRGRDNDRLNLVGRWTFREGAIGASASGAGAVKDLTGRNNGTATNTPTYAGSILGFTRRH